MRVRRAVLVAVAALVAAAAMTAHAATLPVQSAQIFAFSGPATVPPAQLVDAPFDTGGNDKLDGQKTSTGQTWKVITAAGLQVNNGAVQCTSCSGKYAIAIVDVGLAQATAAVNVLVEGTASGGLMLNANASGSSGFVVLYGSGTVQLLRYAGGTTTQLAQATVPVSTNVRLVATYNAGVYRVSADGQSVLTFGLNSSDKATADANTYFGVVLYDANGTNRLDNFAVTQ